MKKTLLCVFLILLLLLPNASASELASSFYESYVGLCRIFWDHLYYMGEKVDIYVPPDNFDPSTCSEENIELYKSIGYGFYYETYFRQNRETCSTLEWNGVSFDFMQEAPNNAAMGADIDSFTQWIYYFTEMYLYGGQAISGYSEQYFWGKLSFNGQPIDPYTAPPNYLPEYDCWKTMRSELGYAWYWEYYINGHFVLEFLNPEERNTLTWNGIEFNSSHLPPNYQVGLLESTIDPLYLFRFNRGYLDKWEDYFFITYHDTLVVGTRFPFN